MKLFGVYTVALLAIILFTPSVDAAERERDGITRPSDGTVQIERSQRNRGAETDEPESDESGSKEESDNPEERGTILNISYNSDGEVEINFEAGGSSNDDARIQVTINGQSVTNNGGNTASGNNTSSDGADGTDGADGDASNEDKEGEETEEESSEPTTDESEDSARRDGYERGERTSRR